LGVEKGGQLGINQSAASSILLLPGGFIEAPIDELSVGRGHWVIEALISLVKCL
jgi:hypothetical protein